MNEIISYISENWILILTVLLIILEAVLRLKPTQANWSILEFLIRLIGFFLPNKSISGKGDNKHKAVFKITKMLK